MPTNAEKKPVAEIVFHDDLKPKKINLKIAPGNWTRMNQYLQSYNSTRTGQKLNYTDIINIAIGKYFEEKESNDY